MAFTEVRIANETETRARDPVCYSEWGRPLTPEQFEKRELTLRAHPWAKARMQTWILRDPHAGRTGTSCETFCMDSRATNARGHTYGIASVFTDSNLRGHGLAGKLLTGVAAQLKTTDPLLQALILFSDVGVKIYARLGYQPLPSFDWIWTVGEHTEPLPRIQTVTREQLLDTRLAAEFDASFSVLPALAQLDWHAERTAFYGQQLGCRKQITCGWVRPRTQELVAAWAADWKENTLRILFNRSQTVEEFVQTRDAACAEAQSLGLKTVTQWEDSTCAAKEPAHFQAKRHPRDGAIPMILPVAPSLMSLLPTDREMTSLIWPECPRALWV